LNLGVKKRRNDGTIFGSWAPYVVKEKSVTKGEKRAYRTLKKTSLTPTQHLSKKTWGKAQPKSKSGCSLGKKDREKVKENLGSRSLREAKRGVKKPGAEGEGRRHREMSKK